MIYIGEGGWGAPQRHKVRDVWWMQAPTHFEARDHLMLISVTPEVLTVTGLDAHGDRFHQLAIPHDRAKRLEAYAEPATRP